LIGRIDADDVLQETWLNAVKRISAFPRDEDLSAFVWFRLIVQQTMIDVRRRHLGAQRRSASREAAPSKWSAESTSFSLSSQLAGTMTSPSEAMMREEAARQLRAQLDQMSALDREVLALRHFEELSNKEAAEVLGLSEQAASVRYVRALKRLQKILMGIPPERESED
jgi:RNA polymerase sigma-70 factor (ECF subfamily)